MAIQSGRLFEIVLNGLYLGQAIVNVFYYRQLDSGAESTLEEIAIEFEDVILLAIKTIQVVSMAYTLMQVREVGGQTEHVRDMTPEVGQHTGAPLASFYALNFKLNRTFTDIRNGSKRIAGIPEEGVDGNSLTGAYAQDVEDMQHIFTTHLFAGTDEALKPTIYRRETFLAGDWFGAGVASSIFTAVSTQRSRKERD